MRRARALMLRVRNLFAPRRLDANLADELESHLQLHVDDNVRAGMTPEEARRRAILMLGGIEQTKERYRDRRGFRPIDEIAQDVRYAARLLRKSLGLTTVAIMSLALGIGANAAIFSLFNHMLLRALPVPDPDQLVNLSNPGPRGSGACTTGPFGDCDSVFSYPMFRDLERLQKVFTGIGAYRWFDANLSYRGETLSGGGLVVSGSYFPVLGAQPAFGRLIGPGDDGAVGASDVVVLSHAYWRQRFGANANVLNDTIVVNGRRMTIVGIARPDFEGTVLERQPEVYVPITPYQQNEDRASLFFYVRTSVEPERIIGTLPQVVAKLDADLPIDYVRTMEQWVHDRLADDRFISVLSAAFAILATLLAAIGLYGVLAYTVAQRTREIGLRMALGAGPGRVRGMVLRQVAVMMVVGGVVGLAGAVALGRAAQALLFELEGHDPMVFTLAAVALTLVALGAGWIPAHRASRIDPMRALKYE